MEGLRRASVKALVTVKHIFSGSFEDLDDYDESEGAFAGRRDSTIAKRVSVAGRRASQSIRELVFGPQDAQILALEDDTAHKKPELDLEKLYMQSPTPAETPDFVRDKMAEFNQMLDKIPPKKKKGYLRATEECPDLCGDDLKLLCLRCEVFRVKAAVSRFASYWDSRIDVFGEGKAFLPMTLDGALKDDIEAVKCKYIQVANVTDQDGRSFVVFDFRKESLPISSESLLRAVWYHVHVALEAESAQKKGVVVYCRCVDNYADWRIPLSKQIASNGRGILPMRMAAFHIVDPPTFIGYAIGIVRLMVGKKMRNRIYVHGGSLEDVLQSLSKFGLDSGRLPDIFGGDLCSYK